MPNYRRHYVAGGTFFFTVVTEDRRPILIENRALLRSAIDECRQTYPFEIVAMVLLPDHLQAVWTLPENDADYSARWSIIERRFAQQYVAQTGTSATISASQQKLRRLGVWQRRFWEHWIRDESELIDVVDYIHYNPVKHRVARCPHEWPHSSFHRFVSDARADSKWCCACDGQAIDNAQFHEPRWDTFE
jgi:putative transposase